jgi:hypothetical protein
MWARGFKITLRHTTVGNTPLNAEASTWQQHTTLTRLTSMPLAGFESAVPASELQQTQALDGAATGIGKLSI